MSEQAASKLTSREEFLKGFLDHLTLPFIKPVAEGFFENIRRVESLTNMPLMMFGMLEVRSQAASQFKSIAMEHWSKGGEIASFLKEFSEKVLNPNPATQPDFYERMLKQQEKVLAIPGCGKPLKEAIQVLYSASVSGSWTAFECLASDLWVAALNEEPTTLAQAAIASLESDQEPGELTAKHIPVGLAARYGFDLRGCLGTILKSKFDFTGVSGIRKAYKVFEQTDDFMEKLLQEPKLGELEATRHVIVHRAGKVDEEYRKRTKSSESVGTDITFSREQAIFFWNLSFHSGTGLLAFVNDYLVEKKAPKGANPQISMPFADDSKDSGKADA